MGQFILVLLGLYAIGCMFYGISTGVQIIQRGFSWLAKSAHNDTHNGAPDKTPSVPPLPQHTSKTAAAPTEPQAAAQPTAQANTTAADASPMQHVIEELREIFALYQQEALTREEFDAMKQRLLSSIKTAAPQNH